MRRLLTITIAAGLMALVAVALVDAFRDVGTPAGGSEPGPPTASGETPEPPGPAWLKGGAAVVERLRREGGSGTLFLSADRCLEGNVRRLRALRLPELELAEGPRSRTCSFTVSADGAEAAGADAVWSPQDPLFAAETGPSQLTLIDPARPGELKLAGSTPAFRPDGTLTHVRAGHVVEWTSDCERARSVMSPAISPGPGTGPFCSRTAVTAGELARSLPSGVGLRSIEALAWQNDFQLAAVLRGGGRLWLAVYDNGRARGPANRHVAGANVVRANPGGGFVGILADGNLEVWDEDGGIPWGSSDETVAFDWSPGGAWLAYATRDSVYLVRAFDWSTQFRLPLSTQGLAWRP